MAKEKSEELVKIEPSRAISPFEEMERWFGDFFRRPFSLFSPSWWPRVRVPEMEEIIPNVDIFEGNNNVVLRADLPGMKKEDIGC